jgi:FkbM family methyltransferase
MINYDNFDWGETNSWFISTIGKEIFEGNIYQKFFKVEQGDIVVDIGASIGPFTYSILENKPKHVFCLEPSEDEFGYLVKNTLGFPVTTINKGISDSNSIVKSNKIFGWTGKVYMETITFIKFINLFSLEKINFLKVDCEGCEYDIFTEENSDYIINNIEKISGEWHLNTPDLKFKFRTFRDNFLTKFDNFQISSVDNIDIKWDLFNEHFLEYYTEVIVYIDNTKKF